MKKILLISLTFLIFGCNSSIIDDPSITINFYVPELAHVRFTIENSYDTEIAVLLDTELQPGAHVVHYDASSLAEGIYYYTIKMTGQSGKIMEITKRMLLIKSY